MPDELPNVGEAVDKVTALIGGLPAGRPDDSPGERELAPNAPEGAEPQAEAGEPAGADELTPTTLAEKLGIKPDELFTTLKIPVDGGEPLTLEEFKDAGKGLRGLKAAQNELAEQRVSFENTAMLQRQTIQAAIGKIPPNLLTPEVIADVQAEHGAHVESERLALHNLRPDLRDPAKWNATRALLIDHLQPYGFLPIEIDSIIDHRLAKYVIDNAERQKRIAELESEGLEPAKRPLSAPAGSPAPVSKRVREKDAIAAGKAAVTDRDKAVEVAKLIGARK